MNIETSPAWYSEDNQLCTMRFCALSCLFLLPGIASAAGSLRVSNVFGSHMVLQRDRPAPVWGWAAPGTAVNVQLGASVAHAGAVADVATGFWKAVLPAQAASAMGRDIVVTASGGAQRIVLQDVVFGEVLYHHCAVPIQRAPCSNQNYTNTTSPSQHSQSDRYPSFLMPKLTLKCINKLKSYRLIFQHNLNQKRFDHLIHQFVMAVRFLSRSS